MANNFKVYDLYANTFNVTGRPLVNGTGVVLTSETGLFYPMSNPSGFITQVGNITNLVYTTGDQKVSGIKIFGENNNIYYSTHSHILGGEVNAISGVTGSGLGVGNVTSYTGSFIGGGNKNDIISANYSIIGGGQNNHISGVTGAGALGNIFIDRVFYSNVVGGLRNDVYKNYGSIAGGQDNTISGNHSFIGGGRFNSGLSDYINVVGGDKNYISKSSDFSTIGGGLSNQISGLYATIDGGRENKANGYASVIAGGLSNKTFDSYSAVLGGNYNTASGTSCTIAGGYINTVKGSSSAIFGGRDNIIESSYCIIVGGFNNFISKFSNQSIIIGGDQGSIQNAAWSSILCGKRAKILNAHEGAAVLADGQDRDHASRGPHTCTLDFISGVYLRLPEFAGLPSQTGNLGELKVSGQYLYIATGQNTWGRIQISNFN